MYRVLITLFMVLVFGIVKCANALEAYQVAALEWLANSTDYKKWNYRHQSENFLIWNFTKPELACSWQGVCCTDIFGNLEDSFNCKRLIFQVMSDLDNAFPKVDVMYRINSTIFPKHNLPVSSVVGISLQDYRLNGRIPRQFFKLTTLVYLTLSTNHLHEHIPPEISQLTSLVWLSLARNTFNGTFPMTICNLTRLISLDLNNNNISGHIPIAISRLQSLKVLTTFSNIFSGTIPISIATMTNLQSINLFNNNLGGEFPTALCSLSKLSHLYLSRNNFHGNLMQGIGSLICMPALRLLDVNNNYLTGAIPLLGGNIVSLSLNSNLFTHTLPNELGTNLEYVALEHNLLTGTLPLSITSQSNLSTLSISSNQLSGSLSGLLNMSTLYTLYAGDNLFDGSISSTIGRLTHLSVLSLPNNMLTGVVPVLHNLHVLVQLFLQGNYLNGQLNNQFSREKHEFLNTVDLSGNKFFGLVPSSLFSLRAIKHVIIVGGCFSGSLPANICEPKLLLLLVLNGLSTTEYCERGDKKFVWSRAHFMTENEMTGSIPTCLFSHPAMNTLQLSGNGFGNQLEVTGNLSRALRNIDLSHNRLSGTIPPQLQQTRHLNIMDLSSNRFSGNINLMSDYFGSNNNSRFTNMSAYPVIDNWEKKSLVLAVNQLSGYLPTSFWDPSHAITVVSGNLFGCHEFTLTGTLPEQDPGSRNTYCGSQELDIILYIGSGVVFLAIIFAVLVVLVPHWSAVLERRSSIEVTQFPRGRQSLMRISLLIFANRTVTFLEHMNECIRTSARIPIWAGRYEVEKSHALHGLPSAVGFIQLMNTMEYLSWVIGLTMIVPILLLELFLKYVNDYEFSVLKYQYAFKPSLAYIKGIAPAIVIACMAIFLGSFLHYHIMFKYDNYARFRFPKVVKFCGYKKLFAVIVLISLDLVLMGGANGLYVSYSLGYLSTKGTAYVTTIEIFLGIFKGIWNVFGLPVLIGWVKKYVFGDAVDRSIMPSTLLAVLMIINNIILPIIVTMASSPNCFYFTFVQQEDIPFSYYFFNMCPNLSIYDCQGDVAAAADISSYSPPFLYNYQCSSSILRFYLPVFISMYVMFIVMSPAMNILLPYISTVMVPDNWHRVKSVLHKFQPTMTRTKPEHLYYLDITKPILQSDVITASAISNFTMLCTFGFAYPVLGFLVCVSMSVDIRIQRYLIGRYLKICTEVYLPEQVTSLRSKLEQACAGTPYILDRTKWLIIWTLALFYSLFVLDMAGNSPGVVWSRVMWLPMSVLLWPFLLTVVTVVHIYGTNLFECVSWSGKADHQQKRNISSILSLISLGNFAANNRSQDSVNNLATVSSDSAETAGAKTAEATKVYYVQYNSPFISDL